MSLSHRCFDRVFFVRVLPALALFVLCASVTAPVAAAQPQDISDADQARNRSARVLAVRTAERLLEAAEMETDTAKRKAIWKQSYATILPFLVDPKQSDVVLWQVAGRIALVEQDDNLAAFAFEAIARLQPEYAEDDSLLDLMADLNARPIKDKVATIPEERMQLVERLILSQAEEQAHDACDLDCLCVDDSCIWVLESILLLREKAGD